MSADLTAYEVRIARDDRDLIAAQRLRYSVFVEELGGSGVGVDHDRRLETDEFDPVCDHLILVDPTREAAGDDDYVVGAYRLLTSQKAAAFGRWYCAGEYDLAPLIASGRRLLELGRSCVARDQRGGAAMLLLWNGLADYVQDHDIEVLFGVASFHGTDVDALKMPLAWLHRFHLAPVDMRPRALETAFQPMNLVPEADLDRAQAMAAMPPLIRAYLRLGGYVGEGAFVDHDFNTTDVMLLMDTHAMSDKHRNFYARRHDRDGQS